MHIYITYSVSKINLTPKLIKINGFRKHRFVRRSLLHLYVENLIFVPTFLSSRFLTTLLMLLLCLPLHLTSPLLSVFIYSLTVIRLNYEYIFNAIIIFSLVSNTSAFVSDLTPEPSYERVEARWGTLRASKNI